MRQAQQDFGGLAGVHGAVAGGRVVEGEFEVEHFGRVDLSLPDAVHQVGQEAADGGRPAVQVHVGHEQLLAGQGDVVADADVADVAAGPGGADGLHHRFLGADRLDDRVRAEAAGELLDPFDARRRRVR